MRVNTIAGDTAVGVEPFTIWCQIRNQRDDINSTMWKELQSFTLNEEEKNENENA